MTTKNQQLIPSVNFHLWEPCNFSCKFCFATFQDVKKSILPKGHLPKGEAILVIEKLAEAGFSKITFAGGEPTLCPWLNDLIITAKQNGLTTMVVTNGTGLTEKFFASVKENLDWVILSIDSTSPEINYLAGRSRNTRLIPDHIFYSGKIELVRKFGYRLKINTVVNQTNFEDHSMHGFITSIKPDRWKLFQTLKVEGQNDASFDIIGISDEKFNFYIKINNIKSFPFAVIEKNTDMQGTYIMVDPAGRFFDNTKGTHTYSDPILSVGISKALEQIRFDYEKFIGRGGVYTW